jgi:hypothetical protein
MPPGEVVQTERQSWIDGVRGEAAQVIQSDTDP